MDDGSGVSEPDEQQEPVETSGRSGTVVLVSLITIVLLATVALGILALQWSSSADDMRARAASDQRDARRVHGRQIATKASTDSLKLKAVQTINAFDDLNRAVNAVAASQKNASLVAGDAITLYNQGDFADARAKYAGDYAAAVGDAATKTASADSALATVRKALADLGAANGG
jgi:hypothetical protein